MSGRISEHLRGVVIVAVGVFVISFDAVLVRLARTDGWNVAFWRGGFMVLSLGLFLLLRDRWGWLQMFRGPVPYVAAVLIGTTGLLFVLSVMHTRAANTVVILSAAPLFAALFTRLFLAEAVRLRTWLAILAAIGGVMVVFAGSFGGGSLRGDLYALIAAATLGANLTLLRRHRELGRVPIVWASGIVTALAALPFAEPFGLTGASYGVLAVMGLVQMPTAMVMMSVGTRYLPAPEVSLFLLLEAVLAPVWVWLAVGEEPPAATFLGAAVIVATLALHSWLGLRTVRRSRMAKD